MVEPEESCRDRVWIAVSSVGALRATGDPWQPYRLLDLGGQVVEPVVEYLKDLQAAGRAAATQRSYGMDLLRWFRFCWAIGMSWDQVTRAEARDFARGLQLIDKSVRGRGTTALPSKAGTDGRANVVTGEPSRGPKYAPATAAHSESVLRHFYDFQLDAGTGPMVNPFPLARGRGGRGANARRSPMEPYRPLRSGQFRPRLAERVPRSIPDEKFNELFAQLLSLRDRALVAFWISTGARASELLGARQADADPGQQLITVIRKGDTGVAAAPGVTGCVRLRLYQAQTHGLVPVGRDEPLWWTLRRPFRALTYDAARAMFTRANAGLGGQLTLHDLRHTAAYRMARDPDMPLTDVQWVLGHAHLSTTQIYLSEPSGIAAGEREAAGHQAAPRRIGRSDNCGHGSVTRDYAAMNPSDAGFAHPLECFRERQTNRSGRGNDLRSQGCHGR